MIPIVRLPTDKGESRTGWVASGIFLVTVVGKVVVSFLLVMGSLSITFLTLFSLSNVISHLDPLNSFSLDVLDIDLDTRIWIMSFRHILICFSCIGVNIISDWRIKLYTERQSIFKKASGVRRSILAKMVSLHYQINL